MEVDVTLPGLSSPSKDSLIHMLEVVTHVSCDLAERRRGGYLVPRAERVAVRCFAALTPEDLPEVRGGVQHVLYGHPDLDRRRVAASRSFFAQGVVDPFPGDQDRFTLEADLRSEDDEQFCL